MVNGIFNGDKALLARAITLVESANWAHIEKANTIVEHCLTKKTNGIRIGITGIPGVGKSTFIEAFGKMLTKAGKKVAVLAVDPTSSISKGSILGDKTRMQRLAKDTNAFIRPSPSSESLGGVTKKTKETIILCEAAGYDIVLVETVGVGQSETAVYNMVDFFLLLKLAGAGDELQGIKRGIIEMADAIIINKADGTNKDKADLAKKMFTNALHLYPAKTSGWSPKVLTASSLQNIGIKEIWDMISDFIHQTKVNSHFNKNRIEQDKRWFLNTVNEGITHHFHKDKSVAHMTQNLLLDIEQQKISPFRAAEKLLNDYTKSY
ncbi:MAG: methylmalonyl Co-A mutase-associated GTPase MeaB [Bacteroidota bacterium]